MGLRLGFVAVAAMLFISLGTAAAGTLSEPQTLSEGSGDADGVRVVVDPTGTAVFVWRQLNPSLNWRVRTRARAADGSLSAVQPLSERGSDAEGVQVALDPTGSAVFSWSRSDGIDTRVEARVRSADGSLGEVVTVSVNASAPHVAVDASGNAVFVYLAEDGGVTRVKTKVLSAGGVLSEAQTLSEPGEEPDAALGGPQVAVDPAGNAVFVWRTTQSGSRIHARARSAAGVLSEVQMLRAQGPSPLVPQAPRVAVDPAGNAVFAWVRSDGVDNAVIESRARSAGGVLSELQRLSNDRYSFGPPQLAVDSAGNAVFTWSRKVPGCLGHGPACRVKARVRAADGTLGEIRTVQEDAFDPQVAVDGDGNAVFVFVGISRSNGVRTCTRRTDGTFVECQRLDKFKRRQSAPQVAVDPAGNAVFVWINCCGQVRSQALSAD